MLQALTNEHLTKDNLNKFECLNILVNLFRFNLLIFGFRLSWLLFKLIGWKKLDRNLFFCLYLSANDVKERDCLFFAQRLCIYMSGNILDLFYGKCRWSLVLALWKQLLSMSRTFWLYMFVIQTAIYQLCFTYLQSVNFPLSWAGWYNGEWE